MNNTGPGKGQAFPTSKEVIQNFEDNCLWPALTLLKAIQAVSPWSCSGNSPIGLRKGERPAPCTRALSERQRRTAFKVLEQAKIIEVRCVTGRKKAIRLLVLEEAGQKTTGRQLGTGRKTEYGQANDGQATAGRRCEVGNSAFQRAREEISQEKSGPDRTGTDCLASEKADDPAPERGRGEEKAGPEGERPLGLAAAAHRVLVAVFQDLGLERVQAKVQGLVREGVQAEVLLAVAKHLAAVPENTRDPLQLLGYRATHQEWVAQALVWAAAQEVSPPQGHPSSRSTVDEHHQDMVAAQAAAERDRPLIEARIKLRREGWSFAEIEEKISGVRARIAAQTQTGAEGVQ